MLIYDDIFNWEGFGGKLRLASGKCRLKIFDLAKNGIKGLAHIRPIVVIASDVPGSKMSVRSCSSHIASMIAGKFNIDPHRMQFIEYYPPVVYGEKKERTIPEKYEVVEFTWNDNKALKPRWRRLEPPMLDKVKQLMEGV